MSQGMSSNSGAQDIGQKYARLEYFLIALFLFPPFWWTLKRPPDLLSIFTGYGGDDLERSSSFVTAISYTGRGHQMGCHLHVRVRNIAHCLADGPFLARKPPYWQGQCVILVFGCGLSILLSARATKAASEKT